MGPRSKSDPEARRTRDGFLHETPRRNQQSSGGNADLDKPLANGAWHCFHNGPAPIRTGLKKLKSDRFTTG